MGAVARHHLAEHVLGHQRRAAHVVDAQLHVRALVIGVVQARDDVRHAEQTAAHFGAHEVRVVELGDGGHDVAIFDTGFDEGFLVEAHTLHRGAVEVAPQVRERVHVLVDDAHVVAVIRQHVRQLGTDAAAADDDHVAHTDPFTRHPHGADFLLRLAYCMDAGTTSVAIERRQRRNVAIRHLGTNVSRETFRKAIVSNACGRRIRRWKRNRRLVAGGTFRSSSFGR